MLNLNSTSMAGTLLILLSLLGVGCCAAVPLEGQVHVPDEMITKLFKLVQADQVAFSSLDCSVLLEDQSSFQTVVWMISRAVSKIIFQQVSPGAKRAVFRQKIIINSCFFSFKTKKEQFQVKHSLAAFPC